MRKSRVDEDIEESKREFYGKNKSVIGLDKKMSGIFHKDYDNTLKNCWLLVFLAFIFFVFILKLDLYLSVILSIFTTIIITFIIVNFLPMTSQFLATGEDIDSIIEKEELKKDSLARLYSK